jgi:hypothetical protein
MDPTLIAKTLARSVQMFTQDLEALPEEAFTKNFGGEATRTIADFVYEVNLVNDHVGMTIRGENPPAWPEDQGFIRAPESFNTKDIVLDAFKKSSDKIIATAESFTPEQLDQKVTTENGESTCYQQCQFMALHLWYHSGQLNYIQTLLGDAKWHWT